MHFFECDTKKCIRKRKKNGFNAVCSRNNDTPDVLEQCLQKQGHCRECDPFIGRREENGAPHDQCREGKARGRERERRRREGERDRQIERERVRDEGAEEGWRRESCSVLHPQKSWSPDWLHETHTRYVPDRVLQVGKVMPLTRRSLFPDTPLGLTREL